MRGILFATRNTRCNDFAIKWNKDEVPKFGQSFRISFTVNRILVFRQFLSTST